MKNGVRAIHPGEILREEYLAPLGVSAHALSQALRLARFFGGASLASACPGSLARMQIPMKETNPWRE